MNNKSSAKGRNYTESEMDTMAKMIRECRRAGLGNKETAQYMNAEGLRKTRGGIFNREDVADLIARMRKNGKRIPRYRTKRKGGSSLPGTDKVPVKVPHTPSEREPYAIVTRTKAVPVFDSKHAAIIGSLFFVLGGLAVDIMNKLAMSWFQ